MTGFYFYSYIDEFSAKKKSIWISIIQQDIS